MRILGIVVVFSLASSALAQNFSALPPINVKDLEKVDSDGNPATTSSFPLKITGIILNTPSAMSNSTPNFSTTPFDVSTYWQIFVQTDTNFQPGDSGGVAVYMAQNYGNIPPGGLTFGPGGVPIPNPSNNYLNAQWQSQLDRVNGYAQNTPNSLPSPGYQLQAGDEVEIDARAGLFFGGKYNVNENHTKTANYASNPGFSFDIKYVGHPGLPAPTHVQLSSIWDSSTDNVTFDSTRASGGELYQGTYVSLDHVRLLPGQAAHWFANNGVTNADGTSNLAFVEDDQGHVFPIQLGTNSLFTPANAPAGWFNAVGIFDQEQPPVLDPNAPAPDAPNTLGYELWITDPSLVTLVPEPSTTVLAVIGLVSLVIWQRRRAAR